MGPSDELKRLTYTYRTTFLAPSLQAFHSRLDLLAAARMSELEPAHKEACL